jgi:TATA-box binding protein (TBP) (component of TFIID and TFIIIB)
MATASRDRFTDVPHEAAQAAWMAESAAVFAYWRAFDPLATAADAPHAARPYEGWLSPAATAWTYDPLGTQRAYHDVPRADTSVADVAAALRAALREQGLADTLPALLQTRLCHRIDIGAGTMPVTIVNIVHCSYWQCPATESVSPAAVMGGGPSPATVSQAFFWRRLQHLGYQQRFVHTSLKLCYIPPLNASHLLYPTGRVLETGANNVDVAELMFQTATLGYLRAAGLRALQCRDRMRLNFVATSVMPHEQRLNLAQLARQHKDKVIYNASNFAGAIIMTPHAHKMLAFGAGPIVCVGTRDFEQLRAAYEYVFPMLLQNALPPLLPAARAGRGRKRRRPDDD